ncbi:MAG: DUF5723 family protein [Dysgonamonadaceae bacterium]|jgi:hypothetical protein|nr:DUF5723 family protein [Dysgonamonadaceae bacterium]
MKQLYSHTKIILALLGASFFIHSAFGQSAHTEYFMSSSYFKTSLNPALRPSRGYIGIPVLTNISVGYRTNTFALDNFLFPGVGENGKTGLFLNENVSYDQFMNGISDQNYLNLDLNETILGFGFYAGNAFLTVDASLRINAGINIPKDVFDFLKKGVTLDGNDKTYDLSNVSLDAIAYGQIGLGGSFSLLDNSLLLGVKVNALLGLANGLINLDKMKLNIRRDQWSVTETQASIQLAMKGLKPKYNEEDGRFDGFDSDDVAIGVNGFGLGFDLGAALKLGCLAGNKSSFLDNLTVSAAVTDLGYIKWDNSLYLATNPTDIIISGDKEISFENSENIFADLEDSFKDAYDFKEKPDKIEEKTNLNAKFNWGIEYAFSKNVHVGFLSTTHFNSIKTISEYTVGGAIRPVDGLEAGLSYSFIHGGFQTVGLSLHLGPFFYIASDYVFPKTNSMFIPVSAKALNLQIGLAIPIGKSR